MLAGIKRSQLWQLSPPISPLAPPPELCSGMTGLLIPCSGWMCSLEWRSPVLRLPEYQPMMITMMMTMANLQVTCLALASTTDLMLAVGSYEGQLAIYQVQEQRTHSHSELCTFRKVGCPIDIGSEVKVRGPTFLSSSLPSFVQNLNKKWETSWLLCWRCTISCRRLAGRQP